MAQDRPIRLLVGFAPGGSTDLLGRMAATALAEELPRTVVVENRAGANSLIATQAITRAMPDGSALLFAASAHTTNLTVNRTLPYDPVGDFTPLRVVGTVEHLLVVSPGIAAPDLPALVALARTRPEGLTYASFGVGGTSHLAGELLAKATGGRFVHVPYQGTGPALLDVIAGNVDLFFASAPTALPPVRDGRVQAIAITGAARDPSLPAVPTLAELGYPDLSGVFIWYGVVGPKGMEEARAAQYSAALARGLTKPDVVARLLDNGVKPSALERAGFRAMLEAEVRRWRTLDVRAG